MAGLEFYDSLPEAERLRRIGELLALGVSRYHRDERLAGRSDSSESESASQPLDITALATDETEKGILRHLEHAISAEPAQIGAVLGIPHTTLVRKLARLRVAGLVFVSGRTRAARYEIARLAQRN